jgi:hypothetical protein
VRTLTLGSADTSAAAQHHADLVIEPADRAHVPGENATPAARLTRGMRVRRRKPVDRPAVESFLAGWQSLRVARPGSVEQALDHPALLAEEDGRLVGVLSYVVDGAGREILTLHGNVRGRAWARRSCRGPGEPFRPATPATDDARERSQD